MNLKHHHTAAFIGAVFLICTAAAKAQTNYFVVAEIPGRELHHDSYILPLSNPDDIAHARALISSGGETSATIVVANIAKGADGINRDYLVNAAPAWSWHITQFVAFADITPEILDAWPTFIENDVDGWLENMGGAIGFWNYTVVDELPVVPHISAVSLSSNRLTLTIGRLSVPFIAHIKQTDCLTTGTWSSVDSFPITNTVSARDIPAGSNRPSSFYRVQVQR